MKMVMTMKMTNAEPMRIDVTVERRSLSYPQFPARYMPLMCIHYCSCTRIHASVYISIGA